MGGGAVGIPRPRVTRIPFGWSGSGQTPLYHTHGIIAPATDDLLVYFGRHRSFHLRGACRL